MATLSTTAGSPSLFDSFNSVFSNTINSVSEAVKQITPLAATIADTKIQLAKLKAAANTPVEQMVDYAQPMGYFGNTMYQQDNTQGGLSQSTMLMLLGGGLLVFLAMRKAV